MTRSASLLVVSSPDPCQSTPNMESCAEQVAWKILNSQISIPGLQKGERCSKSWQVTRCRKQMSLPSALRLPLPTPATPPIPMHWSAIGTNWWQWQVSPVHQAQVPICLRVPEVPWSAPRCGFLKVLKFDAMGILKSTFIGWIFWRTYVVWNFLKVPILAVQKLLY